MLDLLNNSILVDAVLVALTALLAAVVTSRKEREKRIALVKRHREEAIECHNMSCVRRRYLAEQYRVRDALYEHLANVLRELDSGSRKRIAERLGVELGDDSDGFPPVKFRDGLPITSSGGSEPPIS